MTPLLAAENAHIERAGTELWRGLSFHLSGRRVGLFGREFSSFFQLLAGEATLTGGVLQILGVSAATAVRDAHVGLALADIVLPDDFRVKQLFVERARLAGLGYWSARTAATEALQSLGISALAKRKLRTLNQTERRAAIIASATVMRPRVVVLEEPFSGLDDVAAASIAALIDRVASERSLILSADSDGAVGVEASFFAGLDGVAAFHDGQVTTGAPGVVFSPAPRFLVWVARSADALVPALASRGLRVESGTTSGDGVARLVVWVPDGVGTTPILEAALEVSAPIVRMIPMAVGAGRG